MSDARLLKCIVKEPTVKVKNIKMVILITIDKQQHNGQNTIGLQRCTKINYSQSVFLTGQMSEYERHVFYDGSPSIIPLLILCVGSIHLGLLKLPSP